MPTFRNYTSRQLLDQFKTPVILMALESALHLLTFGCTLANLVSKYPRLLRGLSYFGKEHEFCKKLEIK